MQADGARRALSEARGEEPHLGQHAAQQGDAGGPASGRPLIARALRRRPKVAAFLLDDPPRLIAKRSKYMSNERFFYIL